MAHQLDPALVNLNKLFSRVASIITIFVGGMVLLGWVFDIMPLKSILPGLASMKVNTAIAFMLSGLALWLAIREPFTPRVRYLVQVLAFLVAVLGLLTLCEYIFGWQLGIDEFLFKDPVGGGGNINPGRMSPVTALNFLLLGTGLLFLQRESQLGIRTSQSIALSVALFGTLSLLGYAFGETSLYRLGAYNQIAIHTALTLIVVSLGLLCARPNHGLMTVITGSGAGSLTVRRLLPAAIFLPIIVGWLRLQGQLAGYYNTEFGLALMVSATIVIFISLLGWNAISLNRIDQALKQAQAVNLRENEERLRYVTWATRDAVWDRDLKTGGVWWNEGLQKLFHYPAAQIEANVDWWQERIHPEDRQKVVRSIQSILETRQHLWSKEYRFRREDGSYANIFDRGYIVYDEQTQEPRRMIGAMADISEQKRIEQALRQSEELFAKVFSASPAAITLTRMADGRFIEVNDTYLNLVEMRRNEVIGHTTLEIGVVSEADRDRILQSFNEHGAVRDLETELRTRSGRVRALLSSMEKIELDGSDCILSLIYDITERKQAEEELRESEQRFNIMFERVPVAAALSRMADNVIVDINDAFERLFGYARPEVVGKTSLEAGINPDAEARDAIRAELQAQGFVRDREVSLVTRSGEAHIFLLNIDLVDIKKEKFILQTAHDITERKRTEEALQDANQKLGKGLEELDQHNREIGLLNELGKLLQICNSLEEADGFISELAPQLFPHAPGALYMLDATGKQMEVVSSWKTLSAEERAFTLDKCNALPHQHAYSVEAHNPKLQCPHVVDKSCASLCVPMVAQHGQLIGLFHLERSPNGKAPHDASRAGFSRAEQELVAAVAETIGLALTNLQLRETLRIQSIRDPLTGLYNRRFMEESLERELRRAARSRLPLGVIMLDLDHFKHFNDTYSHAAGDTLLRELGRFFQAHIRAGDIACRYGGEEFLLILPEATLEITKLRAEKLRAEVSELQIKHRSISLGRITLSLGVAVFPDHGQAGEEILRAVDAALYRAKRAGRDRVMVARRSKKKTGPQ